MCIGMANGGKTPKEMTPQEALNILDKTVTRNLEWKIVLSNALEKQIPIKPIEDGYYDLPYVCPKCGSNVANEDSNVYQFKYCYHCGQALDFRLDWSITE